MLTTRRRLPTIVAVVLCCGYLGSSTSTATAAAPALHSGVLELGAPFAGHLADGETAVFRLELPAGVYLRLEIEHLAVDLALRLEASDGVLLVEAESRSGLPSPRFLAALTTVGGTHQLTVRTSSRLPGAHDYGLVLAELRPARAGDGQRVAAARRLGEGFRLATEGTAEASAAALASFEAMLALYRELADPAGQALAGYWIGLILGDLHRHEESLEPLARALDLWRQLERGDQQAEVLYRIGISQRRLGRLDEALDSLQQALTLCREIGCAGKSATGSGRP